MSNGPRFAAVTWQVLEEMPGVELRLVNAQHVKNVPGRKTDVSDAAWLAQLLECGLLRGSFVPEPVMARLRDLTRYRKKLVEDRAREVQRIQKLLRTEYRLQGFRDRRRRSQGVRLIPGLRRASFAGLLR